MKTETTITALLPTYKSMTSAIDSSRKADGTLSNKIQLVVDTDVITIQDFCLGWINSIGWKNETIQAKRYAVFAAIMQRTGKKAGYTISLSRRAKSQKITADVKFVGVPKEGEPRKAAPKLRRSAEDASIAIAADIKARKESAYSVVLRLARTLTSKQQNQLIAALQSGNTTKTASAKAKSKKTA